MLYDPRWEQKTDKQFAGISLRGLIAWLETKPADEQYEYSQPLKCVAAQYLQSMGCPEKDSSVDFGGYVALETKAPDRDWLYQIVSQFPQTFGAALERARHS